jgi:hypothetical protein
MGAGRAEPDVSPGTVALKLVESTKTTTRGDTAMAERARTEEWSYERFAEALLSTEVASRDAHGGEARIKQARFPTRKTLEEFAFSFQRSVQKTLVLHLAQLDFLHERSNIVLLGPPGHRPGNRRAANPDRSIRQRIYWRALATLPDFTKHEGTFKARPRKNPLAPPRKFDNPRAADRNRAYHPPRRGTEAGTGPSRRKLTPTRPRERGAKCQSSDRAAL